MTPEEERINRGRRLKMVRAMLDKTQTEFAELCGFSSIALALWETGKYSGLSQKGAQKVLRVLEELNIICSLAWLWHGLGHAPYHTQENQAVRATPDSLTLDVQHVAIKAEMALFLETITDSFVFEVADDAMIGYQVGDYVGAKWSETAAIDRLDKDVLVLLADQRLLLRRIGYDRRYPMFFLYASNADSKAADLRIDEAPIQKFAEVMRVWKVV